MHKFRKIVLLLCTCLVTTSLNYARSADDTRGLHDSFDAVLRAHVDDGHVDYGRIKSDPRFADYLDTLKNTNAENLAGREEKLAFWINAYNALAIKGILDGLSPSSLLGRYTYFKSTDYEAGGQTVNLYDLERDIIIPFAEPRIHFAIVCASYSCPKLRAEAYTAASLESQLQDNSIDFLNDPKKNQFDAVKKRAKLSKIFDWFKKDFEKDAGSVQKYIAPFIMDASHGQALMQEEYRIRYLKYQWTLNGSPPG